MTGAFDFDPDRFIERPAASAEVAPLRSIPDEWEHGLTLLADRTPPHGATPERWAQVVADALQIATRYQEAVLRAGWDAANLFGFDPDQPQGFVGLAVRMRGRSLVDITATEATLKAEGRRVIHRPHMPADAPLLWNFRETGGRK
jgi:hypothetical protein